MPPAETERGCPADAPARLDTASLNLTTFSHATQSLGR
jgi:hypothetical protein